MLLRYRTLPRAARLKLGDNNGLPVAADRLHSAAKQHIKVDVVDEVGIRYENRP